MKDIEAVSEYAICPYCDAHISRLAFRMIETEEERFSEKKIMEMQLEIEHLSDQLETNHELELSKKMIYKNRIERLEMELQKPTRKFLERVYICPECERVLAIQPENAIKEIIELVSSTAFDIRNLD